MPALKLKLLLCVLTVFTGLTTEAVKVTLDRIDVITDLGKPIFVLATLSSTATLENCEVTMEPTKGLRFSYQGIAEPGAFPDFPVNTPVDIVSNNTRKIRLLFAALGSVRDKTITLQFSCETANDTKATTSSILNLTVRPPPISDLPGNLFVRQQGECKTWHAEHLVSYFKNILILRPTSATFKALENSKYPRLGDLDIGYEIDEVIQGSADGITHIEGWSHASKPYSSSIAFGATYLAAGNDGVLHWQTCSPQWLTPISTGGECSAYRVRRLTTPPVKLNERCEAQDIEHHFRLLNVQPVLLNGVDRLAALKELWFEETRHRWDGGPIADSVLLREPYDKSRVLTMTPERLETLR